MQLADFAALHMPALETDEARHNLILALLGRALADPSGDLQTWTLGPPGACAIRMAGRPIILGEVDRQQARALAQVVRDLDYDGVVGPDRTAPWFIERAQELGHAFADPMPQRIHALSRPPAYSGAPGHARSLSPEDAELFHAWRVAFSREAVPHDPPSTREGSQRILGEGRHLFWIDGGAPVAMAGIVRRTRTAGAIAAVYTPPALRGRGYAGSVTAAIVERVFAEGRKTACLYTDLRNPASNRCYAKVGFTPVCDAWHCVRQRAPA